MKNTYTFTKNGFNFAINEIDTMETGNYIILNNGKILHHAHLIVAENEEVFILFSFGTPVNNEIINEISENNKYSFPTAIFAEMHPSTNRKYTNNE